MVDMDNYTIPPELFYSKSLLDSCKRKPFKAFPSVPIVSTKKAPSPKRSAARSKRRRVNKHNSCPELGRLGNVSRRIVKKKKPVKVLKLKTDNIQPEKNNNVEVVKFDQPLNPECMLELSTSIRPNNLNQSLLQKPKASKDEVKKMEELIKKRFYVDENYEPQRLKGKSFKFFKTKNTRPDESTEESDDDLVPEIKSFLPSNNYCSETVTYAPNSFEEDLPAKDTSVAVTIEALLENLESDDEESPMSPQNNINNKPNPTTIQNVIDDLESTPEKSDVETTINRSKSKYHGIGTNQMQIDAGQKNFGIKECKDCGFQYNTNVPEDEKIHDKHHTEMMSIPKFRGWANEKAIEISDWNRENGRVIHLEANHKNIQSDFVTEIIDKMDRDFGVALDNPNEHHIYLAVLNSKVVGLAAVKESVMATKNNEETSKKHSVKLGIQRMYVRPQYRRRGVARGIIKTISILHSKGEIFDPNEDMAFSTPTADGRKFIQNLIRKESYLVY